MSEIDNIKQRCDLKVLTYLEALEAERDALLGIANSRLEQIDKLKAEVSLLCGIISSYKAFKDGIEKLYS